MKLLSICSSSKGNSTYIGTKESGIAIDIGCSYKAFCAGLTAIGANISSVKAILVTHEHSDHIKGLLTLTKHNNIPIYAEEPTLNYLVKHDNVASTADLRSLKELNEIDFDAEISSFPTPHDAESSVGYVFDFGNHKLGFATDLGHVTQTVRKKMSGCRTVFVEANYQPEKLMNNPNYPTYLKARISSENGHLSNHDSAEFCTELVKNGAVSIVLGHLSQENNTPQLAFETVKNRLKKENLEIEKDFMLNVAPVNNMTGEYISF